MKHIKLLIFNSDSKLFVLFLACFSEQKMEIKMEEPKMQAEDAAFLEEQLNQLLESTLRMEADLNAAFRSAKN